MIHPGRTSYSNAQALGWALDVAQALEYLHMRCPAVLHRDVKSANIMLADEGGSMVAKLSDFGLHVVSCLHRGATPSRVIRGMGVLLLSSGSCLDSRRRVGHIQQHELSLSGPGAASPWASPTGFTCRSCQQCAAA